MCHCAPTGQPSEDPSHDGQIWRKRIQARSVELRLFYMHMRCCFSILKACSQSLLLLLRLLLLLLLLLLPLVLLLHSYPYSYILLLRVLLLRLLGLLL